MLFFRRVSQSKALVALAVVVWYTLDPISLESTWRPRSWKRFQVQAPTRGRASIAQLLP